MKESLSRQDVCDVKLTVILEGAGAVRLRPSLHSLLSRGERRGWSVSVFHDET
jgi:hypothetical protein